MTALLPSRSSFVVSTTRFLAFVAVFAIFLLRPLAAAEHAVLAAAGEHGTPTSPVHSAAEHAEPHKGLTPEAMSVWGFVTNSMIVTWIVAAGIIIFAQIATRRIRSTKEAALTAPTGVQNFWEFLVESLRNFLEEILGRVLAKKTFWFFATVFILILFTNWFGLLPGVGTIGWEPHYDANGAINHIGRPLLRGGNADLNMTFAMSAIFFVMWTVWAFQSNGAAGFVKHLFGAKGGMKGMMGLLMAVVFIIVGLLEVISILFRPVSLSFRLYGNIFAGENLLESMQGVSPALGWLTPLPFYFMELLVGLVQALVFMLLTAVFTLLICSHDEEHEGEGHAHH
jgi:F-type H+-transporting ATPase subunit a